MNEIIQERIYENKQIADLLKIGDSTLRKWAIAFEKQGYTFTRNNKGDRLYTDHDIIALRTLKNLTAGRKMTIENGISAVILQFGTGNRTSTVTTLEQEFEQENERYNELKSILEELGKQMVKQGNVIERQNEMIAQLVQRLDLQEKREQLLLDEVQEQREMGFWQKIKRAFKPS